MPLCVYGAHAELTMAEGKHCLVTLTTDFGMEDGNVGVMKGVILGINPHAAIIDLSHDIPPQGIADAAYVLRRAYEFFPQGTVHVVVVDPGVGTERRPIAMRSRRALFVAPDNGVLTYVLDHAQETADHPQAVHLNNPAYWLPEISHVFHGRDIFAPVAAHLSLGVPIEDLGRRIDDPLLLPAPHLVRQPGKVAGQVMHADHFGNLLTNIPHSDLLSLGQTITTKVGEARINGLCTAFGHARHGEPIAYVDSSGHLAIAVVNGSAQKLLHSREGERVEVVAQHTTQLCNGETRD
jgi:S-adenosylmethionine hydrolase